MASKQPVSAGSPVAVGAIPTSPAIKDSPAVERALSRSKIYLLVSWSLLYPEDDEFLDYVQCGEFVDDGRAALEALDQALDAIGGERAKLKLVLLRNQLDQIEKIVASECVNWKLSDLQAEHRRVFSNVITLDCPPYELAHTLSVGARTGNLLVMVFMIERDNLVYSHYVPAATAACL